MQWSLVAVILTVNALFGASFASAEKGNGQISSVFEAFGYSPACVASALTSCEFSSTKELSVDVVDSIEATKSLLQEMKSEIKAIRQEMQLEKKAIRQEMQLEKKAIRQEIKSEGENTSSVVKSLLQDIKSERENEKKSFEILLDNIENITHRISSLEVSHQSDRENISKSLAAIMASLQIMNPRKNCADLRVLSKELSGGVQTVYPCVPNPKPMVVFCDQVTDGGGWTVIQSRSPFPVRENFYRNWTEYVEGFGDLKGEFWLGLDNIHALTNSAQMELRIDLEDAEGQTRWAHYATFHVGDAASEYVLRIGGYSGDAGDGMTIPRHKPSNSNGMKFSSFDNDNDLAGYSCAERHKGGWWHNQCFGAHLNGLPIVGENPKRDGILWEPFHGWRYSMKKASMRIRPVSLGF